MTAIFIAVPVITESSANGANCAEGGVKIEYAGETFYVCNGEEGEPGETARRAKTATRGAWSRAHRPAGSPGPRRHQRSRRRPGPQGPREPRARVASAAQLDRVVCRIRTRGRHVRVICRLKTGKAHNKRHAKRHRVSWRLMQGGHAVRHGATSVRRLQRSLNHARSGRYVLRIAGQGGRRIQLG